MIKSATALKPATTNPAQSYSENIMPNARLRGIAVSPSTKSGAKGVEALVLTEAAVVTPPVTPRSLPQPLSLSGAKYLATRVLTRPRHAAVVALDRVVAVIFNQRTLDAIGRRDAHVLSTIVRAAASSGHDQL